MKKQSKGKVYISGKISGDKKYRAKFWAAERKLRALGYEVLNPARMIKVEQWKNYRDYLQEALLLMFQADFCYMLPDWTESDGAKAEFMFATACANKGRMQFLMNINGEIK